MRLHFIEQIGHECVAPTLVGLSLHDALLEWADLAVISGHFSLSQGDRLPTDRVNLTVLRDPMDRFLSEYFFIKNDNSHRMLDARKHTLGLEAYIESLSTRESSVFSAQIEMLYPLGTSSQQRLGINEKLVSSINALDDFQFVGLQEELDDFACMLDVTQNWIIRPLALKNVTSQRLTIDALSNSERNRLADLLEPEFDLYSHAKSRFLKHRRAFIQNTVVVKKNDIPEVAENNSSERSVSETTGRNFGDRRCFIKGVLVRGNVSGVNCALTGEILTITVEIVAVQAIETLNVGVAIKDSRGVLMYGTNSMLLGHGYSLVSGEYAANVIMQNRLPVGSYRIDAALIPDETHYDGCYHWLENAASLQVDDMAINSFQGRVLMDADIDLVSISPGASCESFPCFTSNQQVRSLGKLNEPLQDFSAAITPLCKLTDAEPSADLLMDMKIENTGMHTWPANGRQNVVVTYRWKDAAGSLVVADGIRTRLPMDVVPGRSVVVPLHVKSPSEAGRFLLTVSMVQEAVAWFVEKNPSSAHTFTVLLT